MDSPDASGQPIVLLPCPFVPVTDIDWEKATMQDRMGALHWLLHSASIVAEHDDVPADVNMSIELAFQRLQTFM